MSQGSDNPADFTRTVRELRLRADSCRGLAERILDPGTAAELRQLADALDAQANGLEAGSAAASN